MSGWAWGTSSWSKGNERLELDKELSLPGDYDNAQRHRQRVHALKKKIHWPQLPDGVVADQEHTRGVCLGCFWNVYVNYGLYKGETTQTLSSISNDPNGQKGFWRTESHFRV